MYSFVNISQNWLDLGIIVFAFAYAFFLLVNLLSKRSMRLLSGSIVGIILSFLDMVLMYYLWHIPFNIKAFLIGFFGYSSWVLIFKIEELDYNGRLIEIGLSAIIVTYMENIVIGGLGTGKMLYPAPYWNFITTLIYFMVMFFIGTMLYLIFYRLLSRDKKAKIVLL